MSLSDTFNYLVYKNPVSKATISGLNGVLSVAVSSYSAIAISAVISMMQSILIITYDDGCWSFARYDNLFDMFWQGIKPKSTSAVNAAKPAMNAFHTALSQPLWKLAGKNYTFVRVAAVSGAAAVCLAAYGKHKFKDATDSKDLRGIYESANNMHLIHSVVLLAVPLTRKPVLVSLSIQ